jgi:hypothetical protein
MMILVDSLLYGIDLKLNKIATSTHQDIPLENKIIALNQAQIQLVKTKMGNNNTYGVGLDGFKKRYEDLQVLVEPHVRTKITVDKKSKNNRWTSALSDLDPKYMFYLNGFIIADKDDCKNRKIELNIVKHADLPNMIKSTHYSPSFEYQETLATISNNQLEVYTDGTFYPKDLHISYIRYPNKIDKEGYEDFEGNQSKNQDCELPDYLEDELVDLAVHELAMTTENVPASEYTKQRIQDNE